VPPRTAVFSPLSLRGCSRSRCPIVHITPPQRPAGEQPSVDTPAPWDHPDAHGDLQLVYLILSSTSSAPCHVGSKDATIPALPRAAWGTVTGIPAHTQLHKRVFQAPGGTARQRHERQSPPCVAARQRPCDTSTAGRRDRDAACPRLRAAHVDGGRACGAFTLTSRGLSHAGKGGAGRRGGVGPCGRGGIQVVSRKPRRSGGRWCPLRAITDCLSPPSRPDHEEPMCSGGRVQRRSHGGPTALEGADIARQHARGKEDNHRTPQVKDPELLAYGEGHRRDALAPVLWGACRA
jgi:hypothetical protein